MKYRSDIDGLRTLAVMPVVLFHAEVTGFSGGFTGVDIFFVISGYLITSILISESDQGRYSILRFYQRRALRILPAFIFVVLVVLAAAFLWMMPIQFEDTAKSAISAALFASNIFFWQGTSYFGGASETKPLLHTWSLSVEEQFYVFFPIVLLATKAWLNSRFALVIAVLSLISFLASVVGVYKAPSATFYLLPTRAWELGIGALMAAGALKESKTGLINEIMSAAGIALIVVGLFWLTPDSAFPGPNALLPCLGAMLLIVFGRDTSTGRILSSGLIRYIGKLSYSLYLWHWPVIVFYRLIMFTGNPFLDSSVMVVVSFTLAIFSYHIIERPFRQGASQTWGPPSVLLTSGGALGIVTAVGVLFATTEPLIRRFPDEVRTIANFVEYADTEEGKAQFGEGRCFVSGQNDFPFDRAACQAFAEGKRNVLLIGDSHAAQYSQALREAYPDVHFIQVTVSGCRPLLAEKGRKKCWTIMNDAFKDLVNGGRKVDGVVLAARWQLDELDDLRRTLRFVKSQIGNVVVLGPTAEYESDFPIYLATEILTSSSGLAETRLIKGKAELDRTIEEASKSEGVQYVSIYRLFCDNDSCQERSPNGSPMQFDYGHLTLDATRYLVGKMKSALHVVGF